MDWDNAVDLFNNKYKLERKNAVFGILGHVVFTTDITWKNMKDIVLLKPKTQISPKVKLLKNHVKEP